VTPAFALDGLVSELVFFSFPFWFERLPWRQLIHLVGLSLEIGLRVVVNLGRKYLHLWMIILTIDQRLEDLYQAWTLRKKEGSI
jgi:hypothetical protein